MNLYTLTSSAKLDLTSFYDFDSLSLLLDLLKNIKHTIRVTIYCTSIIDTNIIPPNVEVEFDELNEDIIYCTEYFEKVYVRYGNSEKLLDLVPLPKNIIFENLYIYNYMDISNLNVNAIFVYGEYKLGNNTVNTVTLIDEKYAHMLLQHKSIKKLFTNTNILNKIGYSQFNLIEVEYIDLYIKSGDEFDEQILENPYIKKMMLDSDNIIDIKINLANNYNITCIYYELNVSANDNEFTEYIERNKNIRAGIVG